MRQMRQMRQRNETNETNETIPNYSWNSRENLHLKYNSPTLDLV